jgi:hypothetical protein
MGPGLVNGPFQVEAGGTGRRDAARAARRAAGATAGAGGAFEAKLRGARGRPRRRRPRDIERHGCCGGCARTAPFSCRLGGFGARPARRRARPLAPGRPCARQARPHPPPARGVGRGRRSGEPAAGRPLSAAHKFPCRSLRRSGRFTEVRSRVHSAAGPANFRKAPHGHYGSNGHHPVKY